MEQSGKDKAAEEVNDIAVAYLKKVGANVADRNRKETKRGRPPRSKRARVAPKTVKSEEGIKSRPTSS